MIRELFVELTPEQFDEAKSLGDRNRVPAGLEYMFRSLYARGFRYRVDRTGCTTVFVRRR